MEQRLLAFLQELGQEMREQEMDGQAHPRFWVIMDYKRVITEQEHADDVVYFDFLDCVEMDEKAYLEDVRERILEGEFYPEDVGKLIHALNEGTIEDVRRITSIYDRDRIEEKYVMWVEYIVPNTFFLLKREAKWYLKKQAHNLSPKAHTYAMTALHSPIFHKLIDLIMELESPDQKGVNNEQTD